MGNVRNVIIAIVAGLAASLAAPLVAQTVSPGLFSRIYLGGTGASNVQIRWGSGDPDGNVVGPRGSIYLRTSGVLYINTDGGSTWAASPVGAQAPPDAEYWVGAANGTLTNEKNLGGFTGLVLNTTGTPSAYGGSSCSDQFPRSVNASGAWTCANVGSNDISANAVTLAKLATQSSNTILANITGGAAVPTASSLSSILDTILGSTQGAIVTRNGSEWIKLDPGSTLGDFLQSQGSGANLAYASAHPAFVDDGNSGTADTIDWGSLSTASHKSTLTGNVTYTFSNPVNGGRYVLLIDTGAGSFTAAWPASVLWAGGSTPTITTTGSKVDICVFTYYSSTSKYYGACSQNY